MTAKELYRRCEEGVKLFWNGRLDDAEDFFAAEKDISPRFALHYAEVSIYRTVITELLSDREESSKRMNFVIKLAEKQIKFLEQQPPPEFEDRENHLLDAKIVYADAHTMLAGLLILEENRVKGILSLRRGWKLYKQALGMVPGIMTQASGSPVKTNYDPVVLSSLKFGAGLFFFILSFIPPGVAAKAAAVAGFSGGNKNLGLQFLSDARSTEGSLRGHMAGMILALNLLFVTVAPDEESILKVFKQSEEFVEPGLQQFSSGCVFQALQAIRLLEVNKTTEAIKFVEAAVANTKDLTNYPAIFLRLLSNCYSMDYNWEGFSKTQEQIANLAAEGEKQGKFKNPWSLTWNTMRYASALILRGDEDKGQKLFRDVAGFKKQDRWSEFVIYLANKYQKTGGFYSTFELMIITQHWEKSLKFASPEKKNTILALIEKLGQKADGSLTPVPQIPTKSSPSLRDLFTRSAKNFNDPKVENRVTYLALKGSILRYQGKIDEAMQCFNEIIDNQARLTDKFYYAVALSQTAKHKMKSSPGEAMKIFNQIQSLVFPFDSAFKGQSRAYMKYLADANVGLAASVGVSLEEPQTPLPEEEEDENRAAERLEKILKDEDGLKDD